MSVKRVPISKKIRFEVFKRDDFTCQYCGKTPPNITLEIDHIQPVSKGGTNDINNLLTSCFDCNRGKSNHTLKRLPNTLNDNLEILKEKEEQLKEYHKLIRKLEKRLDTQVKDITEIYESFFTDKTLKENFKNGSLKMFLRKIDYMQVIEAMTKACSKMNFYEAPKYFCGICWNIVKGTKASWEE